MKPDWKDAPDWARWLAMDSHNEWFWFSEKPELRQRIWEQVGGKIEWAPAARIDWRTTLEERPQ